jgi:hypothetical protein
MLTYFNAFISGELNPLFTHVVLLGGSIIAEFAVAAGIILESPKTKSFREWLGMALVLGGVSIGAVLTISLFVFDEGISRAQQSKIIALETRIAPRFISVDARNRISEKMRPFSSQQYFGMLADVPDAWDIWREINLALELAGWQRLPPPGLATTHAGLGPPAGIAIGPESGVMILYSARLFGMALRSRPQALADALRAEGIAAGAGLASGDVDNTPNAIAIVIGPKPQ